MDSEAETDVERREEVILEYISLIVQGIAIGTIITWLITRASDNTQALESKVRTLRTRDTSLGRELAKCKAKNKGGGNPY